MRLLHIPNCAPRKKAVVLYASPSVRTISGYDPSAMVGRDGFSLVVPEDVESARNLVRDSIRQPGEGLVWRGRMISADGRVQLIEVNMCNRLDDPSVRSIVVNYRDVSERTRLEDALRQAAKMEVVGRLAGGIAHDFNNLLTVVLGNLELVRGGDIEPDDAEELLASAEKAAKQAADLTKQMLGFARRQPLQSAVIDLNALECRIPHLVHDPRGQLARASHSLSVPEDRRERVLLAIESGEALVIANPQA